MNTQNTHVAANLPKPTQKLIEVRDLKDRQINIRVHKGQDVWGVKSQVDTYNIDSLVTEIIEFGGVRTPLKVMEDKDGNLFVLGGHRRREACLRILNDPQSSQEIIKAVTKVTCDVYKNLDEAQIQALLNDQDQKRFTKTDFVNMVWRLQQAGWSFAEIAMAYYAQYAAIFGAQKQLASVELADKSERATKIKTWLRGSLDQTIMQAFRLGLRVRKAYMLCVMREDLLLTKEMEQPEFKVDKSRCDTLNKLKNEDPNWSYDNGGEAFNAQIEKYISEDKGLSEKEKTTRPDVKSLRERQGQCRSRAAKAAFQVAAGDKVMELGDVDAESARAEDVMKVIQKHINYIKHPDVGVVLAMVLRSVNTVEMESILAKYM